jgi:hypothetical protein
VVNRERNDDEDDDATAAFPSKGLNPYPFLIDKGESWGQINKTQNFGMV